MIHFGLHLTRKEHAHFLAWAHENGVILYDSNKKQLDLEHVNGFIKMYWNWGTSSERTIVYGCNDDDFVVIKIKYNQAVI